jgi:hypothetical protein
MAKNKQTQENKQIEAKQFNSISEIINDPYFIEFVYNNVAELRKERINRPGPEPGYHYKRDWFDRMNGYGNVNYRYFIENIESIWLKKSKLSSEIRNIIQYVCDKSFNQMTLEYQKHKEQ